jgi:hypothetical protein
LTQQILKKVRAALMSQRILLAFANEVHVCQ